MSDIYSTRKVFTNKSTKGILTFEDFECRTLEDTCRDPNKNGLLERNEKVWGKTAIPSGVYQVEVRQSKRYGKRMPYLLDVPFFEGIMIHPGNTEIDTHGCILVGSLKTNIVDMITESKKTFELLMPKIEKALAKGILRIHIAGGVPAKRD
jgi:hypothetical protein